MTSKRLAATLARVLAEAGVSTSFGVPGGGPNLDVVSAFEDAGIDFVLAHGESSAAIMASTHGLLTRTPTPVVVTRGPGATSVANGTAQATLDRFPLVVITDTVPGSQRSRVAHQRVDQRAFFDPITTCSATVGADITTEGCASLVARATTWPFGAVHVDYDAAGTTQIGVDPVLAELAPADTARLEAAAELVAQSVRPVVIVGAEAAADSEAGRLGALLTEFGAPVLATYQATGIVDTEGPVGAGLFTNGALEAPILDAADLIITIGLDLVEPIPAPWTVDAPVVRISTQPQLDDYLPATVDLVGPLPASTEAMLRPRVATTGGEAILNTSSPDVAASQPLRSGRSAGDLSTRRLQLADAASTTEPAQQQSSTGALATHHWVADDIAVFRDQACAAIVRTESSDTFGPVGLVRTVLSAVPPTITTTVDAGAHFLAIMPLWRVDEPHRLLISNGLATMAFAVPAAIGAATARPGEPVLALTGDGGMSMVLAELETIARRRLPITVVVFNDAALSLIRIKQKPDHGDKNAVTYRRTDFAQAARAMGIDAHVVKSSVELHQCLETGWDAPRLIDARIDPASYGALLTATRG